MIEAEMFRKGDRLAGWIVKGHAGADTKGHDIVCAAVSSAVYMAANTITEVCHCEADITEQDGFLSLSLPAEQTDGCQTVMQGISLHLAALSRQYPQYISFKITEV